MYTFDNDKTHLVWLWKNNCFMLVLVVAVLVIILVSMYDGMFSNVLLAYDNSVHIVIDQFAFYIKNLFS